MNQIQQVFGYGMSQLRTVLIDNDVWFVAKDVCDILEVRNTTQAIARLEDDERTMLNIGRQGATNLVNEPGLYSLIMSSRKPEARAFKRWITHDVIPQIRKTGSYSTQVPQTFSEALRLAADLQEEIEKAKPKIESFDRFISGKNYQKMGDVAKILGYGRNNFFKLLREMKILMRDNTPYQEFINRGYFVVKEKPIQMGSHVINKPQTYVTAKGIHYIDKLLKERSIIV